MSRWVSKYAGYSLGVRTETRRNFVRPNGSVAEEIVEPALVAQFLPIASASANDEHVSASQHDISVAMDRWAKLVRRDGTPKELPAIPSLNAGVIGGQAFVPFDIRSRFGVFDTDWLPEQDRDEVDAKLRSDAMNGNDYVEVVPVALDAPWPNYDKTKSKGRGGSVADVIAAKVVEDGYDAAAVVAYEKANKNRADVIAAIEAAAAAAPEEQDESALEVTL